MASLRSWIRMQMKFIVVAFILVQCWFFWTLLKYNFNESHGARTVLNDKDDVAYANGEHSTGAHANYKHANDKHANDEHAQDEHPKDEQAKNVHTKQEWVKIIHRDDKIDNMHPSLMDNNNKPNDINDGNLNNNNNNRGGLYNAIVKGHEWVKVKFLNAPKERNKKNNGFKDMAKLEKNQNGKDIPHFENIESNQNGNDIEYMARLTDTVVHKENVVNVPKEAEALPLKKLSIKSPFQNNDAPRENLQQDLGNKQPKKAGQNKLEIKQSPKAADNLQNHKRIATPKALNRGQPETTPLQPANATVCEKMAVPESYRKPAETFDWYKIPERDIYAFSAFFDDRASVGGPLVRVMALGLQLKFNDIGPVHCLLVFTGLPHPVSVPAQYVFIYPSNMWADEYTAHWILCPVPQKLLNQHREPVSVSVLPLRCEPAPFFFLPVHVKELKRQDDAVLNGQLNSNRNTKRVALCLPALYSNRNYDDWVGIAEWIILHKLLGYSSVYIYVQSIRALTDTVLKLYESGWDEGINVHLVKWGTPKLKQFYMGQHQAINDCLYRAGLTHDYVAIHDKDEVLMPMNFSSMPAFLDAFEDTNTAAFLFQHVMFDGFKQDPISPTDIKTMTGIDIAREQLDAELFQLTSLIHKNHMTQPYPAEKVRSKTIYNVKRSISADIHAPRTLVPGMREKLLAPSDGVVYHYRSKSWDKWLTAVPYERGTKIDLFKGDLLQEIYRLIKKLGVHNISGK